MARDFFNQNSAQLRVVGGILSPVSDAYGKPSLINSEHRVEMCRLACENDTFITVDSCEASQPTWTPTLQVLNHFDHEIKADPLCSEVKIMLIAGSDLVEGFKNETVWAAESVRGIIDYGLVVIERSSTINDDNNDNVYMVPQLVPCEISSSKLRYLLQHDLSIKYLTNDKVIDYIHQHNLYK